MSNQSIQTLKGFRDFLPAQKRARDYVADKIRSTFERFGFEPLETPTLEYADLLLGKYGTEADKLVYTFEDKGGRNVGLRYDQTVPTARVLAQYQNELPRYFRRYQIQNVFRADKPQAGRFREFTQCDIDIFGSNNPLADAEILACTYFSYQNIGFNDIEMNINDRVLLMNNVKEIINDSEINPYSIIQTLDKLDKKTPSGIIQELTQKGLNQDRAEALLYIKDQQQLSPALEQIISIAQSLGIPAKAFAYNPLLARGLDYYTGMIFEVTLNGYQAGAVGGGGRYDNLIKDLGGPDIPAVGMAFGFDRTIEAATQLNLIPPLSSTSQILVSVFNDQTQTRSLEIASLLRTSGVATEVYPSLDKLDKQFKLANQKGIPFVLVIGPDEQEKQVVTLKNMKTGEQVTDTLEKVIPFLQSTN